ncbi:MAG: hypothetical protein IPO91_15555 [Chloroflexi bacterium]|nr:hypothetical protein [Chloroflexota bacterium]
MPTVSIYADVICRMAVPCRSAHGQSAGRCTGGLFVVDWDQPVIAPKERDLMFISGGRVITAVTEQQEAAFFAGYGQTEIDREALIYYRAAWVVQDIGGFAEQVFLLPDLSVEAKRQAIHYFVGSFAPDSIAESALQ